MPIINFPHTERQKRLKFLGLVGVIFIALLFVLPPVQFPTGEVIRIKSGLTVSEAAHRLEAAHVVTSPLVFTVLMKIAGGNHGVVAGDYLLARPMSVVEVVIRLAAGAYGQKAIKVTIPEGSTLKDVANLLAKNLPKVSVSKFMSVASTSEGYLFPDTYFFYPSSDEPEVLETLTNSFDRQIITLNPAIKRSGLPLNEIVIMASILEKEAPPGNDQQIIAGILWKRFAAGMKLQVDSAPITYKKAGLPPAPIANPGLGSLKSAATPTPSPYWFYLSDKTGAMHYAIDHAGHLANIKKYLR